MSDLFSADSPSSDTKACPMCGETVKRVAKKCKHCKAWLEDVPEARQAERIWWEDKVLAFEKYARLPQDHCIRCARPSVKSFRRTYQWVSSWVYVTIVFGVLPLLILFMILRKSADVKFSLCANCKARRGSGILTSWLVGLACAGAFVGGFFVAGAGPDYELLGMLLILGGFLGVLVTLVVGGKYAAVLEPTYIDDTVVKLKGVSRAFLQPPNPTRRGL